MASIITKSSDGKIWKNTSGKIIKAKVFSEDVIQNGLDFWGRADANFLTIVDGLVYEAYDIRGTGQKMIQNTIIQRPIYSANSILFNAAGMKLQKTSSNAKSMFLVVKFNSSVGNPSSGLGIASTSPWNLLGCRDLGYFQYFIASSQSTLYKNLSKHSTNTPINYGVYAILHSLTNFNQSNFTCSIGSFGIATPNFEVKEWGWYDRVLNELEVIYNINALNARYSIF